MFSQKYDLYLNTFEGALKRFCADLDCFSPLAEGMRYSLLSGGKRVRPVLFYATLDLLGLDYTAEQILAIALECIHTYSLIHDDLPAMDNDDYRRGVPSNHKIFGEANAILAGDGLLSLACSLAFSEAARDARHLAAGDYLFSAAGVKGMVAGQSADLLYTGKPGGQEELSFIYEHKTSKLLAAPVVMAALLAGANPEAFEQFGMELGRLFQLTDDLLDVKGQSAVLGKSVGKDGKEDKLTCVKVYGLRESELLADRTAAKCRSLLDRIGGDTSFLKDLVTLVRERDN